MSKQLPMRTLAEQDEMSGRPRRQTSYVPAMPARRAELPAQSATTYTIDAHPSAQLGSITHTSAVDRAKGYTIIQAPLAAIMAVLVLAVAKSLAGFPLLSFAAFLVFWVSFALVWLAGWGLTLLLSAEGVAFYEARRKWNVVEREQDERWNHYNSQQIGTEAPPMTPAAKRPIDWFTVLLYALVGWGMVMMTLLTVWLLTGGIQ